MKIVLVNPDSRTKFPQPPLGLLSIAGSLQMAGHKVVLIDCNSGDRMDGCDSRIQDADMVGFTGTSLTYQETVRLMKMVPYKPKMIGGVHATLFPEQALADGFDVAIAGEGELTVHDLSRDWRGVIRQPKLVDMDALPVLPYELLDAYRYRSSPVHSHYPPTMPMMTSRGCPWSCTFCDKTVFGNRYRAMSPARVVEELQVLKARGVREVAFYDDTFTVDRRRVLALCWAMVDLGLHWTCQARVNTVDTELLSAMQRAGCEVIAYGVESGVPEILKNLNKHIDLDQAERAIRYTREAGIRSLAYFMFGAPGETRETVERTTQFAISLDPDYAQFSMCTPLPGSELYERRRFLAYTGPQTNGLCSLSLPYLARSCAKAYLRFYGRPGHIVRGLRSWTDAKIVASWINVVRTAWKAAE